MKGTPERLDDRPGARIIRVSPYPPFHVGLVESRLEEHPKVLEACVLQVREKAGKKRLIAHVVTRDMSTWTKIQDELKAWLRADADLGPHMVPYRFFRKRELPLLPKGLVDRRRLASRRSHGGAERVSSRSGDLPVIREPWDSWKFEGLVTSWERRRGFWYVELAHRPVRAKGAGFANRLSIRVPQRLTKRVRLGERLAMKGRFFQGRLLAEEVHVVPRITRIGLEDHVRVLEAASG